MVIINPFIVAWRWEAKIARCDQVKETPDDNKITVFKSGKAQQSNESTPCGGQSVLVWDEVINAQTKNAQKKEKKNIISLTINKHIPKRIPSWTLMVWWPSYVASTTISENHCVK
jgi:hypothetical protein